MAYTFKHGERPIEGYTIQRAVGKGGFGEVYYAVSDGGREVALKYLRDNPQIELRGVSNCINLKSPHLVSIFDVKKTVDGEYAIIMEYCSGPSLRDLLIAEPSGFEPQKAAFFMREIAKGLSYLHDRGIVHRDLKPGNIFYDDGYVKIGDYGLSKFISVSRHSGQTASVGTVHYMAPEIGSGNYSKGVDIYALGVMLYEMLLGKVPFEGSSMAEVLMKHLTTQPQLDELPQPFGRVIRKALQKDPNDRYQSVDEMVDELLDVETVRRSLAGFSTKSLEGAVRRGTPERFDSPMPSPNPRRGFAKEFDPVFDAGQPPFAKPIGSDFAISEKLTKRMNRISRKMEAKMAKLGHPTPPQAPPPPPQPGQPQGPGYLPAKAPPVAPPERRKRMLLSGVLSISLAIGLGLLIGANMGEEEGAAAGLLTVTMAGAIILSRGAVGWFGIPHGPRWAQRMIYLCCSAPFLAIGSAPLLGGSSHESEGGTAIFLAMLILAVIPNWEKTFRRASTGDVSFGRALFTGAFGLGLTAAIGGMMNVSNVENWMFITAGAACAATIIIQATAWWLPRRTARAGQEQSGQAEADATNGSPTADAPAEPVSVALRAGRIAREEHRADRIAASQAAADRAVASHTMRTASSSDAEQHAAQPPMRWGVTRAFWGLISFGLMSGAIVTFLIPLVTKGMNYHDVTAAIITCTGCTAFLAFSLRKTTPYKRIGLWRETVLPFFLSVALFGMGGTITGIAREWNHRASWSNALSVSPRCVGDEGRVGLIAGLVMSGLLFGTAVGLSARKRRPPRPFLMDSPSAATFSASSGEERPPTESEPPDVLGDSQAEEKTPSAG